MDPRQRIDPSLVIDILPRREFPDGQTPIARLVPRNAMLRDARLPSREITRRLQSLRTYLSGRREASKRRKGTARKASTCLANSCANRLCTRARVSTTAKQGMITAAYEVIQIAVGANTGPMDRERMHFTGGVAWKQRGRQAGWKKWRKSD
ncbi:hypothetical protein KM043_002350 [Ampulex compressa]|nr:hypothetical protein KM043_002350 [Ampulex compressa]